jgi:predicted  nucleic acid-binding Zn-ribbon protein
MLQGCPDCGGTKFEYIPAGRAERPSEPDSDVEEDTAQQAARGEMITADELPAVDPGALQRPDAGQPTEPPAEQSPAVVSSALAEQFESIRIVAPGEYELNLQELYDRDEYIISLQEDGRYIIDMANFEPHG